jgi:uncharacterized protein with GYD domain
MATFISLLSFTEQGARNVKDTLKRAEAFKEAAGKLGLTVQSMHWTMGNYDLVVVIEGNEEAALASLFSTASLGNVRTQTLRAFTADEVKKVIGLMK